MHIWNSPACNAYTNEQLQGVTWQTGVLPAGTDANYGLYWLLDLQPGVSIDDCANFIIHKGDLKALNPNDQIAVIDDDRVVYGVQRYGDVFPDYWVID